MNVICDYCGQPAALVSGKVIYRNRPDLSGLKFWHCAPCDAYVGCHKPGKNQGNGTKPLGRLANAELRRAKSNAHAAFDPIWQGTTVGRSNAYSWLAEKLGIPKSDCHIGMFNVEQCKKVVEVCRARYVKRALSA